MEWSSFTYFALASIVLWAIGAAFSWKGRRAQTMTATIAGTVVFFTFIMGIWTTQQRPPLQTMGETRLWYSALLPLIGLVVYAKHGFRWILPFSTIVAAVFIIINIAKPDLHDATLMPALQSAWFAPHVILYMFSYALFGAATLLAVATLASKSNANRNAALFQSIDTLLGIGLAFMTIAMLMGAFWAKEAWGHYWTWDAKETWAAAAWLLYLTCIHLRLSTNRHHTVTVILLIFAYICLQMCWWGINLLPATHENSMHLY